MKLSQSLVLGVAALAVASGCTTTVIQPAPDGSNTTIVGQTGNQPGRAPIIASFDYSPKSAVGKNDFITFTLVANDPSGQPLQYNWAATRGRLTANTGATVAWQPMKADGTLDAGLATVTVIVSNGVQTSTGSVNIQISDDGTATISQPPVVSQPVPSTPSSMTPTGTPGSIPPTTPPSTTASSTPTPTQSAAPASAAPASTAPTTSQLVYSGVTSVNTHEKLLQATSLSMQSNGDIYYSCQSDSGIYFLDAPNLASNSAGVKLNIGESSAMVLGVAQDGSVYFLDGNRYGVKSFKDGVTKSVGRTNDLKWVGQSAMDAVGNIYYTLYFSQSDNKVYKMDPSGKVSVIAGDGTAGYKDGPASSAQFNQPGAIACDDAGNLYVADNHVIRKIDATGNVSTFSGSHITTSMGSSSEAGDVDGSATTAKYTFSAGGSQGLYYSNDGSLYAFVGDKVKFVNSDGTANTIYYKTNNENSSFIGARALDVDSSGNIFYISGGLKKLTK